MNDLIRNEYQIKEVYQVQNTFIITSMSGEELARKTIDCGSFATKEEAQIYIDSRHEAIGARGIPEGYALSNPNPVIVSSVECGDHNAYLHMGYVYTGSCPPTQSMMTCHPGSYPGFVTINKTNL